MDKFWELLKESVIVSGLIALAMVFVACYLWATGQEVPEPLFVLLGTVVGFFFGAKKGTSDTHRQYASATTSRDAPHARKGPAK